MRLFSGPRLSRTVKPVPSVRLELESLEERAVPSADPGVSTIQSNFNGTPLAAGDTVWFSSVAKVSGVPSSGATLQVVNAEIDYTANGQNYQVAVPNADLTFSPTATTATTSFDASSNTWMTTVPLNPGGNVFLDGVALPVPAGLPGGIKNVSWTATFESSTGSLQVNWQWAAAAYTSFGTDYNSLNVKPVDSNQLSAYQNSDHAGTPEAFKPFVVGGARGGGGSNFTGSYSGTASVQPTQPAAQGTLSGFVFDQNAQPLSGVMITLSWTDASGVMHSLNTITNAQGAFSFSGLAPETYTITQTPPPNYVAANATVGTVDSNPDGTVVSNAVLGKITLNAGDNGINYDFTDDFYAGS